MAFTSSSKPHDAKVLVVDDEVANLQKLYRTLVGRYPVLAAKSGGEALRFLEQDPEIAVIVTDQRMPDMTGIDLLRHSLTTHPNAIRVILTGFTDADVLMDAINTCKVFRYLVKPWEPVDLLVTIERGLETYRLTLENERFRRELIRRERLARELEIAREIQRYILPPCCPALPGYEVAVEYHPAWEVGGDLYDFHYSPETGIVQMVLGDVSGKSVPAALYGAVFSGQLRTLFAQPKSPADSLSFLNASLIGRTREASYIAVGFLRLDLATNCLTFANGGMPYPFCVGSNGVTRLELPGLPLGLFADGKYEQTHMAIQPGDLVVLASDGCTEAEDFRGEPFGDERVISCIEKHRDEPLDRLVRSLYDEVCRFMQGNEIRDDITLLALRRRDSGD
ncbi:MAG TPA: SpoIIE family protein phosphatase [Acidobacteriota bacterium]|nr:SpoIIE family protein phosphatase [Acidobacteriota bacterium]